MPDLHETINQFLEGSIASIGRDPVIESKSITANGTYTAPEGVDGYSPITVNVPTPTPVIESKSITANGTYTAPEGVDGYSPITVNVPLPQNAYLLKSVANLPQAIASFNDGEDMVMPSLKVAIEPQQEGSGDPSPTNIRPISGWDEVDVTVADDVENPTVSNVYTIDLDGTRYGGEVDVVNGIVTPAPYYASYNGETLTGEWISDRDKYEVGATPTIGAQVVNIGASGTPVSILPTAVKSLRGVNNVYANTGNITDAEYFSKEG